MKETKFTKGEWGIATIPPNGCIPVGTNGLMVCMTAHSIREPDQEEEAMANAHLIKAAPKMYAILERAVNYIDNDSIEDFCYEYQNIKSLLAEARGEV